MKGKRGDAILKFDIFSNDVHVGQGEKKLVLSGLRDYEEQAVQSMTDSYLEWKQTYKAAS